MIFMSVLLPAPFSPSTAWISPGKAVSDTSLFATTAGNVKFEYATKSKKRVRVVPAATVEAAETA